MISAQILSATSSGNPKMAAMVEGFISQALCMAEARMLTNFSASSNVIEPLTTSAENSPSE